MNTFASAVNAPERTVTTNGMAALDKTGSKLVDLFFSIGSARNDQDGIGRTFAMAYGEDKNLAAKTLFWARDVRGGAGERQTFRNLMLQLEKSDPAACKTLIPMIPEYGRWDDLLIFNTPECKRVAFQTIALGLQSGDGLCAKWMPRKGANVSVELRNFLGWSPKRYRKTLVTLSNTVEQKMCAQEWDAIEFDKLPSIASKQYMKAFGKHAPVKYTAYKEALAKGDAKINASAIFPHDVIVGMKNGDVTVAQAQWDALPDYLGDNMILPMVDVSGSMDCKAGNSNATCLDVAVALGLYCADKQKGKFHNMFLSFSAEPELIQLTGNSLKGKMDQMNASRWGMNTNIEAAFKKVLNVAVHNGVPQNEMPKVLLIMSDMQFDACVSGGVSSTKPGYGWQNARGTDVNPTMMEMLRDMYAAKGYEMPKVVFWNLNAAYGNAPTEFNKAGVALISGFSPAVLTAVLKGDNIDPWSVMMNAIGSPRYSMIEI